MPARIKPSGRHWTQTSHLKRRAALRLAFGGTALLGVWLALGRRRAQAAGTRLSHKRIVPYPRSEAWPAAIRYLRVDRNYALVDRDPALGYVLFDFPLSGSQHGRGSIEIISTTDASGRPSVSLEVNTEAGPSHLPHALAEGIAKKLREERGPPAAPPAPKSPQDGPPKDAAPKEDGDDPPFVLNPTGPGEG